MAYTQFDKDMQIIQKLNDRPNALGDPSLSAAELKAKFDEGGEAIKAYLNGTLVPEMNATAGDLATDEEAIAQNASDITVLKAKKRFLYADDDISYANTTSTTILKAKVHPDAEVGDYIIGKNGGVAKIIASMDSARWIISTQQMALRPSYSASQVSYSSQSEIYPSSPADVEDALAGLEGNVEGLINDVQTLEMSVTDLEERTKLSYYTGIINASAGTSTDQTGSLSDYKPEVYTGDYFLDDYGSIGVVTGVSGSTVTYRYTGEKFNGLAENVLYGSLSPIYPAAPGNVSQALQGLEAAAETLVDDVDDLKAAPAFVYFEGEISTTSTVLSQYSTTSHFYPNVKAGCYFVDSKGAVGRVLGVSGSDVVFVFSGMRVLPTSPEFGSVTVQDSSGGVTLDGTYIDGDPVLGLSETGDDDLPVRVTNVAAPTLGTDAANKAYVDNVVPPVDSSLSVANAAADAKATGDAVGELKSQLQTDAFRATKTLAVSDFNNYLTNGAYLVNSGSLSNRPDTTEQGILLVFAYNTTGNYGYAQIYITNSSWRMFYRAYVGGAWKDWREVVRKNDLADFSGTVFIQGSTASGNFNSYVSNGAYFVNSAMTNAPVGASNGLLCVFTNDKSSGYGTTQIFIPQNANYKPVYRYKWNSAWSDWSELYAGVSEVDSPANQNVLSPANFTLTGYISTTDGTTFTSNSNYMCTNDFIDVPFGTQNIYAVFPQTENNDRICAILYYDADGNYTGSYSGRLNGYNYKTATLSGGIDVAKIKFWVNKTTVSGGSNEVCISFSTVQSFPHYEAAKRVSNNALETPEIYLPFVGKTIVNFGDSIFGNKRQPFSVSYALEKLTGATVYNCGFGGTDMAARSSATWDAFSMYRLAYAIANNDFSLQNTAIEDTTAGLLSYFSSTLSLLKSIDFNDVNIITIAFGTNDFKGDVVLDNESDPDDTTKFCGALRYSLDQIMAAFPHIKIFVCGQTYRFWMDSSNVFIDDSDTHENGNGDKLTDFVAATKSVSAEYHVPFIDNYNIGINKINRSYYFPANDGTHHNYLGAELIADHIKHEMF